MNLDFTIGSKEEAIIAAEAAETTGANYVNTHGAYVGIISKASFKKFSTGSGGFEIEAVVPATEEESEQILKVMIITMTKKGLSTYTTKDGKTLPLKGVNQITGGLLPVVKMKTIPAVKDDEGGATYPSLNGKKVGFLVDIRKTNGTGKNKDKVYENPSLVSFFCPETNKTGSEILKNEEPKKKAELEKKLKVIDETSSNSGGGSSSDPFGDNDDAAGADDPFASDTGGEETGGEEKVEEKENEKVEDAPSDENSGEAKAEAGSDEDFWN